MWMKVSPVGVRALHQEGSEPLLPGGENNGCIFSICHKMSQDKTECKSQEESFISWPFVCIKENEPFTPWCPQPALLRKASLFFRFTGFIYIFQTWCPVSACLPGQNKMTVAFIFMLKFCIPLAAQPECQLTLQRHGRGWEAELHLGQAWRA